jgi:hypothetical protein
MNVVHYDQSKSNEAPMRQSGVSIGFYVCEDGILILVIITILDIEDGKQDRDYLYVLGPSDYVPPKNGNCIRSPKLGVLNKIQLR